MNNNGDKLATLSAFYEKILDCKKCDLSNFRKRVVTGEGGYALPIVLVGEAPGKTEDELGRPFSGRAGKLLDSIMSKNNITRKDVYIVNAVKCRPPSNRKPNRREILICSEYLREEIDILRPKLIVTLGVTGLQGLSFIGTLRDERRELVYSNIRLKELRGKNLTLYLGSETYRLLPTFHPAACLRNPFLTKELEKDLKSALKLLEEV